MKKLLILLLFASCTKQINTNIATHSLTISTVNATEKHLYINGTEVSVGTITVKDHDLIKFTSTGNCVDIIETVIKVDDQTKFQDKNACHQLYNGNI